MEFKVEKQSMGRANDGWLEKRIKNVFRRWQDRWLVLGYNNLFYTETAEDPPGGVRDNIAFDNDTVLNLLHVGRFHVVCQFEISRRNLKVQTLGTVNGIICMDYMIKAFSHSPYTPLHRFTSFAPVREGNDCVFFSDGVGYYKELKKALDTASQEVMITDWWFSPELPLLRPIQGEITNESNSRLDRVLQRAAHRGVRVYILVYREFSASLNTDSYHAKTYMKDLHPNIKVLRHPNVVVSLWSHHEKIVIIDKQKVFMGGLDLCWGRMDGNNHPLFNDAQMTKFPGADYYNPLKKDIALGREYQKSAIEQDHPRMPWHDVGVMLVGKVVSDFAVHFNAYWNHAKETSHESEVLMARKDSPAMRDENGDIVSYNSNGEPIYNQDPEEPDDAAENRRKLKALAQQGGFKQQGNNPAMNLLYRMEMDRQLASTNQNRNAKTVTQQKADLEWNQGKPKENRSMLETDFRNYNPNQNNPYGQYGQMMPSPSPYPNNQYNYPQRVSNNSSPASNEVLQGNNADSLDQNWEKWKTENPSIVALMVKAQRGESTANNPYGLPDFLERINLPIWDNNEQCNIF